MKDIIIALIGIVGSGLTFLALRQSFQNAKLRKKLRHSLCDNIAQYKLEELYCHELMEAYGAASSHLSIKRAMRLKLRMSGQESPSSECTPFRLTEEIAKV